MTPSAVPSSQRSWRTCALAFAGLALSLVACDAPDPRVDPGDLELRDLLGVSPGVAASWGPDERAAVRRIIADARPGAEVTATARLGVGIQRDERIARALQDVDDQRADAGQPVLVVVRISVDDAAVQVQGRAPRTGAKRAVAIDDLAMSDRWSDTDGCAGLPARGRAWLADFAAEAGHAGGPLLVVPAPRLAAVAAYVEAAPAGDAGADGRPHLLVNPVALASLEAETRDEPTGRAIAPAAYAAPTANAAGGNPYSFYGSVAECAAGQRVRCDSCATGGCEPITDAADGAAECAALSAEDGRGYYLLCINLALAIAGVQDCARDDAPGCPRVTDAAGTLAQLGANTAFLDDAACQAALDGCLGDLYGDPDGSFPTPGQPDGGVDVPAPTPRPTSVDCGDTDCELSPSCDVSGPTCEGSSSCDACSSDSSSQSGCDGTCDSCESSDSSGDTSGSCISCDSDDGGGSDDSGSCGGDSGSGSDDSGCGGDSGSGSSDGCGSCGDGSSDCGSCDSGSSDCGNCDSGGNGSCHVGRKQAPLPFALALAALWASLPVPMALLARRRARRRRWEASAASASADEVTP